MTSYFPPGLVLVLPTSQTVAQKRVELLKSSSGVLLGARVYSIGRLERTIVEELTSDLRVISDLGRDHLLEYILKEAGEKLDEEKRFYSPHTGFLRGMGELIKELRMSELTPRLLADSGRGILPESRLTFIENTYLKYLDHLTDNGLTDNEGRRLETLRRLDAGSTPPFLSGIHHISFIGFSRLTPFQIQFIRALARHFSKVDIHLSCPSWLIDIRNTDLEFRDLGAFSETIRTIQELERTSRSVDHLELFFETISHGDSADLAYLEAHLLKPQSVVSVQERPDDIEVWAAPGIYAEVEAIGREIGRLVTGGVKPDRIAVAFGDLSEYGQMVEDVFRRFRLPLFFRRGAPLAIQGPVRAAIALIRLANSSWNREQILDLAASPYLDLGIDLPVSRLAEITAKAGMTDERAGVSWERNLNRLMEGSEPDRADAIYLKDKIRQLKELITPLSRRQTWGNFLAELRKLLGEFNLEDRVKTGGGDFLHRDAPAWLELENLMVELEQAARESGAEMAPLDSAALEKGFFRALRNRNIGGSGLTEGGIMVLSAYDLHGLKFDYLFMAGLNEGVFPKITAEGAILNDNQVMALNQAAGRRYLKTRTDMYQEYETLFYHGAVNTQKKLILSYSKMDNAGRLLLSSSLLDEIQRLWSGSDLVREIPLQAVPNYEDLRTTQELLERLAWDQQVGRESAIGLALLGKVMKDRTLQGEWKFIQQRGRIERMRYNGLAGPYNGLIQDPDSIGPWLAKLPVYHQQPLFSPTFFQQFGECPFKFWVNRVLAIAAIEEPEDEMNALDEGGLIHSILSEFMVACRDRHMFPLDGRRGEGELLEEIIGLNLDRAEDLLSWGRSLLWKVRRLKITRMLRRWLAWEQRLSIKGTPICFEWEFSGRNTSDTRCGASAPLEIPLCNGGSIYFRGRIDRVDEGDSEILVLDYKNSGSNKYNSMLKLEEMGTTSIQAPVYQAVAALKWSKPARSSWVLLRNLPEGRRRLSESTEDLFFNSSVEIRKTMSKEDVPNFYNRIEAQWVRMRSGDFSPAASESSCEYCGLTTVCRRALVQAP